MAEFANGAVVKRAEPENKPYPFGPLLSGSIEEVSQTTKDDPLCNEHRRFIRYSPYIGGYYAKTNQVVAGYTILVPMGWCVHYNETDVDAFTAWDGTELVSPPNSDPEGRDFPVFGYEFYSSLFDRWLGQPNQYYDSITPDWYFHTKFKSGISEASSPADSYASISSGEITSGSAQIGRYNGDPYFAYSNRHLIDDASYPYHARVKIVNLANYKALTPKIAPPLPTDRDQKFMNWWQLDAEKTTAWRRNNTTIDPNNSWVFNRYLPCYRAGPAVNTSDLNSAKQLLADDINYASNNIERNSRSYDLLMSFYGGCIGGSKSSMGGHNLKFDFKTKSEAKTAWENTDSLVYVTINQVPDSPFSQTGQNTRKVFLLYFDTPKAVSLTWGSYLEGNPNSVLAWGFINPIIIVAGDGCVYIEPETLHQSRRYLPDDSPCDDKLAFATITPDNHIYHPDLQFDGDYTHRIEAEIKAIGQEYLLGQLCEQWVDFLKQRCAKSKPILSAQALLEYVYFWKIRYQRQYYETIANNLTIFYPKARP